MTTQTHTGNEGGLPKNRIDNKSNSQLDTLISSALDLHKSEIELKLAVMLGNADENLIKLIATPDAGNEPVDEAETGSDPKNDYFEKLSRTLNAERDNIENFFFKAINEKSNRKDTSKDDSQALNSGLSLIDQGEMDEMVAVAAMYTNAMNLYGEEVNNLATRFDYLEMSSNRSLPKHIFDIRHICEAFQTALTQAEFPTDHKLLLFKLFDQDVSSQLVGMYKSINQLFIDAGVLPEVVYTVKNENSTTHSTSEHGPGAEPAQSDAQPQYENQEHQENHVRQGDSSSSNAGFHHKISQFFNQFMSGLSVAKGEGIPRSFSTPPAETDSQECFSRDELVNSLSRLQNDLANADIDTVTGMDAEHIKRAVIANMGSGNGGAITKAVHTHDQRYIDFVGMIFQEIADDESISMVITNLLMLLQIPIIKIAMHDEELFTENDHPARITLDLITKAGRGVTETADRIFTDLKRIVDGLLHEQDIDRTNFENAVQELQSLITKEEETAAENEKKEQYEIIKQHARNVVLGEMRLITQHKIIPESTRPLMLKYWPSLMFNQYINHGIESSEWFLSLKIFNLLMECLQPVSSESQWKKLKQNHESLVEIVQEELFKTRKNKDEIEDQISALSEAFATMLDTCEYQPGDETDTETDADEFPRPFTDDACTEADSSDAADEEHGGTEHDENAARIEEQVRISKEKIARLPSNLHPGAWFEVFDGDDKPVRRLKLSVILADVAKLVFVDRQGTKVIEKDADEFLQELNNEQSKFIADHSTFEHALGSVIHKFAA